MKLFLRTFLYSYTQLSEAFPWIYFYIAFRYLIYQTTHFCHVSPNHSLYLHFQVIFSFFSYWNFPKRCFFTALLNPFSLSQRNNLHIRINKFIYMALLATLFIYLLLKTFLVFINNIIYLFFINNLFLSIYFYQLFIRLYLQFFLLFIHY